MLTRLRLSNVALIFKLGRRIGLEHIAELETILKSEPNDRHIVLDLKDGTLVGQDAITFLKKCETENMTLKNCAAYIREWITRQRGGS